VYGRNVDDQTLAFGHSGILYRKSFVMYDRGTGSHWVHTTGECVKGELKGKQLEFFPSVVTDWKTWKSMHPTTTVLMGKRARGRMGIYTIKTNSFLFGISVGQGEATNLYRVMDLKQLRLVHDTLGDQPIVVFFNLDGMFATAWEVEEGQTFSWDDEGFVDQAGNSFDMILGRNPNQDQSESLTSIPATAWLTERWQGFYPNREIYVPPKKKSE